MSSFGFAITIATGVDPRERHALGEADALEKYRRPRGALVLQAVFKNLGTRLRGITTLVDGTPLLLAGDPEIRAGNLRRGPIAET